MCNIICQFRLGKLIITTQRAGGQHVEHYRAPANRHQSARLDIFQCQRLIEVVFIAVENLAINSHDDIAIFQTQTIGARETTQPIETQQTGRTRRGFACLDINRPHVIG